MSETPDYKELVTKKLKVIDLVRIVMMVLFTTRLFYIQIVNGEIFQSQKQKNYQRSKLIPAQRGEIFDRNGDVPLVANVDSFAVDVIPGEIESEQFATVITKLAAILKVPV